MYSCTVAKSNFQLGFPKGVWAAEGEEGMAVAEQGLGNKRNGWEV